MDYFRFLVTLSRQQSMPHGDERNIAHLQKLSEMYHEENYCTSIIHKFKSESLIMVHERTKKLRRNG